MFTLGLLHPGAVLTLQAWVAAFEASGRDRSELCNFEGLLSLCGLRVRSILLFFSGDGVLDFFSSGTPGDNVEALRTCVRLAPPELFRGAIAGRYGRGGGRERSV